MIPPDKLTPENGFVDGVLVKYGDGPSFGYWHIDPYEALGIKYAGSITSVYGYNAREFSSAIPLEGPMSIWNYAPTWATHCFYYHDGDILWFDFPDPEKAKADIEAMDPSGKWTQRPWWAQRREE